MQAMFFDSERLNWAREGADWPHREASSFHTVDGIRWHVQRFGRSADETPRPVLLLIHGTGASVHSWRDLAPLLCGHFEIVAIDLPGHGFTAAPMLYRPTLPNVAASVADLMRVLGLSPAIVAGHSAGAAIAIQMVLGGLAQPAAIVSFNGALLPFEGAAGHIFPSMAKLLFLNPLTPRVFASQAGDLDRVERLLRQTGSRIGAEGIALYARLFRTPAHVGSTLSLMANWDLHRFAREMTRLTVPLILVAAERDGAVPPGQADEVARRIPSARVERFEGLGHLAHEEAPDRSAGLIIDVATKLGIVVADAARIDP